MNRKFLGLIAFIFLAQNAFCQTPASADSLTQLLNSDASHAQKARWWSELSIAVKDSQPRQAFIFADSAMEAAQSSGEKLSVAEALKARGRAYIQLGETDSAIAVFESAEDIYEHHKLEDEIAYVLFQKAYAYYKAYRSTEAAKAFIAAAVAYDSLDNKEKAAECHNNVGLSFWAAGHFGEAIGHYRRALVLYETLQDDDRQGRTLNNIGTIYWGMGSYNNALDYYQRALYFRRKTGDKKNIALILNNMGLVYQEWKRFDEAYGFYRQALSICDSTGYIFGKAYSQVNIGAYYQAIGENNQAIEYYQKALQNYSLEDKKGGISLANRHLGNVYGQLRDFDKALHHYDASLNIGRSIGNYYRQAIALCDMAEIYFELGQNNKTLLYARNSREIAREETYRDILARTDFIISRVYEKQGDLGLALQHYKSGAAWQDSLFNYEKMHEFTDLQIRYSLEQKEAENALLRKDNEIQKMSIAREKEVRNFLIIIALMALALIFALVMRQLFARRTNRLLQDQNSEIMYINRERQKLIEELQEALQNVKTLHGLLPICSSCKKIRDDQGYWNELEKYVSRHSEAKFSHSMCPDCTDSYFNELEKMTSTKK